MLALLESECGIHSYTFDFRGCHPRIASYLAGEKAAPELFANASNTAYWDRLAAHFIESRPSLRSVLRPPKDPQGLLSGGIEWECHRK